MQLFLIHVNFSNSYMPWKNSCKFSNPYIFVIRGCKSLKFQMKVISRVDYESSFSHLLKFHFRICDKTFFIFSKYFKYINCHTLSVLAHRGENQDKNNKFRISASEIFNTSFLTCEDIKGDHVNLGVSVLSGLWGGHLNNLAGAVLDQIFLWSTISD